MDTLNLKIKINKKKSGHHKKLFIINEMKEKKVAFAGDIIVSFIKKIFC